MIVGVMQPYFFPYLGYFQLMGAVDCFVFHDDVQYIKGGWVNRNRLLVNGGPAWCTAPVAKDAHERAIDERVYQWTDDARAAIARQVEGAYRKAPHFPIVQPRLREWLAFPDPNVARFNRHHLVEVARAIGISSRFLASSELEKDDGLRAQERVIEICRRVGGTTYVNPIGGLELYEAGPFRDAGLDLRFLRTRPTNYPQFGGEHVPFLSILDVLMFRGFEGTARLLSEYDLVAPEPA